MVDEILSVDTVEDHSGAQDPGDADVIVFIKADYGDEVHPLSAVMIQFETSDGGWVTQDTLRRTRPSLVVPPGVTWRVYRKEQAADAACGVDRS